MLREASDAAMIGPLRGSAPDYAAMIRSIGGGGHGARDLDGAPAFALFAAMLAGEVPALELGGILVALGIKGESLAETIAFKRALDACVGRLEAPADCPLPVILPTYGSTRRQPTLIPLLAILLRRYGVPVVVHGPGANGVGATYELDDDDDAVAAGGRATQGRVTTLAILLELGVEPARSLADAQRLLAQHRIAYVPVDVIAPGLVPLLGYRARLGGWSCAHSLAKLIDPFHVDGYRVIGVTPRERLRWMREILIATHAHALLLVGTEGEPPANPPRMPQIESFADGAATFCTETVTCGLADVAALPAAIDALAAWVSRALAGSIPVPAPVIAQLACCLQGTRRAAVAD